MAQDALGNDVSIADAATLAGIDDFVLGFLGYEKKAANILASADAAPDSTLANVYAGFIWMFLEASAGCCSPSSSAGWQTTSPLCRRSGTRSSRGSPVTWLR